jgi:hypothetical protein
MEKYKKRGAKKKTRTYRIQVFFLKRTEEWKKSLETTDKPWYVKYLDSVYSWWTKIDTPYGTVDMRHVEMMFDGGSVTGVSQSKGCFYEQTKNPERQGYINVTIQLTPEEFKKMQSSARWHAEKGITETGNIAALGFVPVCGACLKTRHVERMFCSQYIVKLFQEIGYLCDVDAARTSPTKLYTLLTERFVTLPLPNSKKPGRVFTSVDLRSANDDDIPFL